MIEQQNKLIDALYDKSTISVSAKLYSVPKKDD